MASKILLRLISEAVVPAFLLLASKVGSLFLFNYLFKIPWDFGFAESSIIPTLAYSSISDAALAHSASNLLMFGVVFLGCGWVVVKAVHFHQTHISPKRSAKLAEINLLKLLTSSYDLYHQAAVWFIFLWASILILLIYSLTGLTEWWITVLGFFSSLIFTYLLIDDIEKEATAWKILGKSHA